MNLGASAKVAMLRIIDHHLNTAGKAGFIAAAAVVCGRINLLGTRGVCSIFLESTRLYMKAEKRVAPVRPGGFQVGALGVGWSYQVVRVY